MRAIHCLLLQTLRSKISLIEGYSETGFFRDSVMSLLVNTEDVEQVAKGWLQRKYGKRLGKMKFVEVMSEGGVWNVGVKVKLATGVLALTSHMIHLKIDSQSTDILGYSDTEIDQKSKGSGFD